MGYYLKQVIENLDNSSLKKLLRRNIANYISQTTEEIFKNIENDEKTLIFSFGANIDYKKIKPYANITIHDYKIKKSLKRY
jgi:ketol-acid reductoisomerase